MSVHGASQMKCAVCSVQVTLEEARRSWWLCTTCGSYVCPQCHMMFRESDQETCPGTISRGTEPHPPHFTRFLTHPRDEKYPPREERSRVVILGDISKAPSPTRSSRVIILDDVETVEENAGSPTGDDNED